MFILCPVLSSPLSVWEVMLDKTPKGVEEQADSARTSVGIQQDPSLSKMNFPKKIFNPFPAVWPWARGFLSPLPSRCAFMMLGRAVLWGPSWV